KDTDYRHAAVVALVDEIIDPLDEHEPIDDAHVPDLKVNLGRALGKHPEPRPDIVAALDRVDHHRMQHAIFRKEVDGTVPVELVPGVEHGLGGRDLLSVSVSHGGPPGK